MSELPWSRPSRKPLLEEGWGTRVSGLYFLRSTARGDRILSSQKVERAWVPQPSSPDRLPRVTENEDWPQEPAERVRELVEGVLDELDLEGDVEIVEEDDRITASVEGEDDYGLLIGKRGQTIDALQLLAYQAAFRGLRDRKRVIVDAAGYRERRRDTLTSRADRAAEQALSGNRSVEMDPMSAQERRVVHEHLKDRSGVETYSEGEEPRRCVVVAPLVAE